MGFYVSRILNDVTNAGKDHPKSPEEYGAGYNASQDLEAWYGARVAEFFLGELDQKDFFFLNWVYALQHRFFERRARWGHEMIILAKKGRS